MFWLTTLNMTEFVPFLRTKAATAFSAF